MALRVGIDLVSLSDVRTAVTELGERYLRRVYTPAELAQCGSGDTQQLAGRFAVKEATAKVLRPRRHDSLPWTCISVSRRRGAAPEVHLAGEAVELARRAGIGGLAVSLSHDGDYAVAVVITNATRDE